MSDDYEHVPPEMSPELARVLAEHSPRLEIERPALIPSASSLTGWVLVVPVVR